MKGKSWSIPVGMVFKKYYCSKCGGKLVKSKTHRVVTKDDKDYYQYHDVGTYPRYDYDVYSYEFKCQSDLPAYGGALGDTINKINAIPAISSVQPAHFASSNPHPVRFP